MKQELTFGEVRAMYFDDTALQLPPTPLYRIDVKGSRHYFTISDLTRTNGEDDLIFYSGVTTITGSTLPKPEALVKWIADMGYENARNYRDERASYGTLMHTIFAHLLINGSIDLDEVDSLVDQYVKREGQSVDVWQWADDLKQDIIAFVQFVHDYDVKPLAIEISLRSEAWGVAGTVDLPCLMTIEQKGFWGETYQSGPRKGEPKETKQALRVPAIIDFKSGRKSYAGDQGAAAQLRLYEILWNDNFGKIEIAGMPSDQNFVRLFNWSPKDWKTNPGYHLVDQTEAFSKEQAQVMLEMYQLREKPIEEKTKTFYRGVAKVGESPVECYQVKSADQLAHEKLQEEVPEGLDTRTWDYLTIEQLIAEIREGGDE